MVGDLHRANTMTSEQKEAELRKISLPIIRPHEGYIELFEDRTGCVAVMSTGSVLWPAAAALIDHLGQDNPAGPKDGAVGAGLRAVELGSGLGAVGLFLSMHLGFGTVL